MNKTIVSNTCLAVIRERQLKGKKGELIFAADRRVSWGSGSFQKTVRPKVVKRNNVLMAGTGHAYLCDLICSLMPIPDVTNGITGFNYIHGHFRSHMNEHLKNSGHAQEGELALPDKYSASILVGVKNELFIINVGANDGIIINTLDAPYADGCGGEYALGSIVMMEKYTKIKSEDILRIALTTAAQLSSGCDDSVDIIRASDEDSY